ncbi:hypothetical protein K469DRAFT_745488 [Zopfia rhizophila CBS 207.26]|uniref:EthD domain-containing protein n=1 Tax=Zopfia rhizophila CBS 207.26 TaxID=1314779 RepID=A0A6A6ETA3_9PEZI|nr:hypothetical protein K469DRAFT_745488 [Zopfia rhizophila CBS 207.26]
MVYSIILFCSRKPGISPAEFKDHWENKHVPLLKSVTGPHFPLAHTRRYISRSEGGAGTLVGLSAGDDRTANPPAVLVGNPEEIDWDGFAELTFKDELHFRKFFAIVNEPDAAARIREDEEMFSDSNKLKVIVVGDTRSTERD